MTPPVTLDVTSRNISNSMLKHLIFMHKSEMTVIRDSTCRNSCCSKEEGLFLTVGWIQPQPVGSHWYFCHQVAW